MKNNSFIENELRKYGNDLRSWSLKVKDESCINKVNYDELVRLNDGIINRIESVANGIDNRKELVELGSMFRSSTPDIFYASEIVEKGYKKIHGYPGDYEMMNYVYNNDVCSKNIIGKYFDRYQLDTGYSQAVRGRKNKMVKILEDYINNYKYDSLKILNLPCGPARDIKELLEIPNLRKDIQIHITCVDQDDDALNFARQSIKNSYSNIKLSFIKGNILSYIRNMDRNSSDLGSFNLVYSIGLADYLPDKLLKKMILFSYMLLIEGGVLFYAFKIKEKDPFAPLPPKWFCDWEFIPRDFNESINLIMNSGIQNYIVNQEQWEETGRICFFSVRKK